VIRTRRTALTLFIACMFAATAAAQQTQTAPAEEQEAKVEPKTVAVLHTSLGDITLGFYPDLAPEHVANFLDLAGSGFYDGTTFHRVIPGFMIQGGDPLTKDDDPRNDGTGNGPRRLKAEFSSTPHKRGIVSAARGGDPNSASCQFFIVQGDSTFLDGKYSVFGYTIEGLDVVDKIVNVSRDRRDRPLENVTINKIEVKKQ